MLVAGKAAPSLRNGRLAAYGPRYAKSESSAKFLPARGEAVPSGHARPDRVLGVPMTRALALAAVLAAITVPAAAADRHVIRPQCWEENRDGTALRDGQDAAN